MAGGGILGLLASFDDRHRHAPKLAAGAANPEQSNAIVESDVGIASNSPGAEEARDRHPKARVERWSVSTGPLR